MVTSSESMLIQTPGVSRDESKIRRLYFGRGTRISVPSSSTSESTVHARVSVIDTAEPSAVTQSTPV